MPRKRRPKPTLPATLVETEARIWARDFYARAKEPDPEFGGRPWTDPDISHILAKRWIKFTSVLHPHGMVQTVNLATVHGELAAHEALIELHSEGQSSDLHLVAYVQRLKVIPFKAHDGHGGRPRHYSFHDGLHVALILDLHERFGLRISRSQIGKKKVPSACSIASEEAAAAGLGRGEEDAFRKLWDKFSPAILVGYRWPNLGRGSAR